MHVLFISTENQRQDIEVIELNDEEDVPVDLSITAVTKTVAKSKQHKKSENPPHNPSTKQREPSESVSSSQQTATMSSVERGSAGAADVSESLEPKESRPKEGRCSTVGCETAEKEATRSSPRTSVERGSIRAGVVGKTLPREKLCSATSVPASSKSLKKHKKSHSGSVSQRKPAEKEAAPSNPRSSVERGSACASAVEETLPRGKLGAATSVPASSKSGPKKPKKFHSGSGKRRKSSRRRRSSSASSDSDSSTSSSDSENSNECSGFKFPSGKVCILKLLSFQLPTFIPSYVD